MFYKLIEVKGYKINNQTHELTISAIVIDNKSEAYLQRWRNSNFHEVEYCFDTTQKEVMQYIRNYIACQRAVKAKKPATYGEALTAMIGTIIASPNLHYCELNYNQL